MNLSGIDFGNVTDLTPLYAMDDLTELWLVDTVNLDASDLDLLLDNLATIEATDIEGTLYMTQADFDAFNTAGGGILAAWDAEPGHHVEIVAPKLQADFDADGDVDGDDFLAWQAAFGCNSDCPIDADGDGDTDGHDFLTWQAQFGSGGGASQAAPEPEMAVLAVILFAALNHKAAGRSLSRG